MTFDNTNSKKQFRFLPCPICGTQTETKVLPDTVLIHYPLFCAKCRQEILVDVVKMKMVLSDSGESDTEEKAPQNRKNRDAYR